MKLIANRPLRGEYGFVAPEQEFEARDEIADQLLKAGLARTSQPPTIVYETKPFVPQETSQVTPEHSFRDVHVPDKESASVAAESDPVLSESDVQGEPAAGSSRRSGRARSGSTRPSNPPHPSE